MKDCSTDSIYSYHPDVNRQPGAEEKFKEISNAYEVLSNDQRKSIYDQYGEAGVKNGVASGAGAYGSVHASVLNER
uniref:J domain-containing protein n=1 Tax=Physcomitrium patens TaxID=3218 RepID=A0A2K1IZN1_PHYPA|nr:hypothetical protein PHYPA_022642 [Physcomitrium patens]